ncbi:MAG: Gfo/Idh/MocA family oxidoreductase [Planctomycetes bacterium]|nr:Gfo/Idh/MocA family oxidoreductase [Planctomycetota bacterium]
MPSRNGYTRRRFIRTAGIAAGGALLSGLPAGSLAGVPGANEFLRLGWVGVGGRGSSLLRHALNLVSVSTLQVAAICDIDAAARQRAVAACGAMKPAGIQDYRELLERKDVDAVIIATPIHLHAEHAVAVMKAGKHCYCEKPLGRTPQEVKAVHEAVKAAGKKFQVGFQWRYHNGFLALVDAVQGGAVGKVHFVTAARHVGGYPTSGWYVDRSLSGDLIVEQAVHEMNIFCWMLKAHPLRAAGFGGINALKDVPPGRTIMDHYGVTYEFPEGIDLQYSHCVYTPSGFGGLHQTVYGSDGRGVSLEDTTRLSLTKDGKKTTTQIPLPPDQDATEAALQSFAQSIREDKEPLANVDAGRNATLMAILGRTAIHERRVAEWREMEV